MLRAIFGLILLGLAAIGGAWLGVKYAPIVQPTLIDLSAFSPELRDKYRDKAYLDEVETRYEMEKIDDKLKEELSGLDVKHLPDGLPPFPLGQLMEPPPGAKWLDVQLQGDDGTLNRAKEGWVVVSLWTTWCSPCVDEMPDVKNAANALGDSVSFFFVNADVSGNDTPADVADTYARKGVQEFPPLYANAETIGDTLEAFGTEQASARYPSNIIYAPGGEPWAIFYGGPTGEGAHWSSPEGIAFFGALGELENGS